LAALVVAPPVDELVVDEPALDEPVEDGAPAAEVPDAAVEFWPTQLVEVPAWIVTWSE
jgi:hypothetical protein